MTASLTAWQREVAGQIAAATEPAKAGHAPGPLTPTMVRELRAIERGDIGDLLDYGTNALAFYARDRVIGALERRGLIAATPDWSLTEAGRAALSKAQGVTP